MRRTGAAGLALAGLLMASCALEPIDLANERPLALRTTIKTADGTFLARLFKPGGNRALAAPGKVPPHLTDAILAAEDARFFRHPGFDLRSIARAALVNLNEGEVVQGGSTITQQYVKNTFFRRPGKRTFERKARELRLSIELERRYSKREILDRYMNTVYFGAGAYGIKAAAETYFGKRISELKPHESAMLAALIKAPSYYDPRERPRVARSRRNYVLARMAKLGTLRAAPARAAARRPLGVEPDPPRLSTREPYFVEAVKREVLEDAQLGDTPVERANALYKGGLEIRTTLRLRMQRAAERAVDKVLGQKGDPEAALVAIDPRTGDIVAMVGGRDWDASQVNLALGTAGGGSGRQPGSSFKPIVAATALEAGISLDTPYDASPAIFTIGDTTWPVRNSEGTTSGQLPIYEALVRSVNGVFARLALHLGAERIATQANLMGVRARLPNYPSIALGSAEVSVLDMAAAYATLANGGTAIEPTTIERIKLATGEIVEPQQESEPAVLSPGSSWIVTRALQDVIRRGTGRAAFIGRPAAGKTGTTDDYADAWFVGYTPDLVAAVWVGYPQGRVPMTNVHGIRVSGGTFPAAIWREFMLSALRHEPVRRFRYPKGELVTVEIDPETGLLAAPWCPGVERRLLSQFVPSTTCPSPPPPPVPAPTPEPEASPSERRTRRGNEAASPSPKPSPKPEPSRTG